MWRQEEYPTGQADIYIVRARLGETVPLESMFISREASPGMSLRSMESLARSFQETAKKKGFSDFGMESFSVDSDVASRFSCMAPHVGKIVGYMVECASTDKGRWSILYFNNATHEAADLNAVLRNLASNP
jgi:hypothetical protein